MVMAHTLAGHNPFTDLLDLKVAGLVAIVTLACLYGGGAVIVAVLGCLMLWAATKPTRIVHAVMLGVAATQVNAVLGATTMNFSPVRWLLLLSCVGFVAGALVFGRRRFNPPTITYVLLAFLMIAPFVSIFTSHDTAISVLKIISFSLVTLMLTVLFSIFTEEERMALGRWTDNFFIGVVIATIAILPSGEGFFSLGFLRGFMRNSQPFGVLIALGIAWFFSRAIITQGAYRQYFITLFMILVVMLILTKTRTAYVAVGLALTIPLVFSQDSLIARRIGGILVSIPFFLFLAAGLTAITFFPSLFLDGLVDLILKYNIQMDLLEGFTRSRVDDMEQSWVNFTEHPIWGIGFGIASSLSFENVRVDPLFGLPIGASVEKGFLPTGVLEEIGIVGFIFFLTLIILLVRNADPRIAGLPVVLVALFVNVGEAVFFSMGGMGVLTWVFFGLGGSFNAPQRAPAADLSA